MEYKFSCFCLLLITILYNTHTHTYIFISNNHLINHYNNRCENCRYMAQTLFQIEESYKDKVNFVMVNGDDPNNWPLIEALGVDAIPHMALLESDGTVDTALIGSIPKEWLSKDIDVLLDNAADNDIQNDKALPYRMLDVFANRPPEQRRIVNLDAVVEAAAAAKR